MKAIGFRIKSGFAIAVVVAQKPAGPAIDLVRTVALADDDLPQSRFPYHPTIELPEREGAALSQKAVKAVRRIAAAEVRRVLEEATGIERAGIVVGSTIDPDKLGNPHVRVHALEGKLFRDVVAESLAAYGVDCVVLVEREAYNRVAAEIDSTESQLRKDIDALGHGKVRPWRAEEKLATLAAWRRLHHH